MRNTASLTRKQQHFIAVLLSDPKMSATQAAYETYNVRNRHVAEQIAYENLRKPEVLAALEGNGILAAKTIVSLLGASSDHVQLRAAEDILDRVYGKATARVEARSQKFTAEPDEELSHAFTEFIEERTRTVKLINV